MTNIQGRYTVALDTRPGRERIEVSQLGRLLSHETAMAVLLTAYEQERARHQYQRCTVRELDRRSP